MFTITGPRKQELIKKILKEVEKHPEGIWIRKLARKLNAPVSTVHKYVTTQEGGYPGEQLEVVKKLPIELGGNLMIKLKK